MEQTRPEPPHPYTSDSPLWPSPASAALIFFWLVFFLHAGQR